MSYLSALMLLCPLQQDSKKRVVENGQKSIYICKTEFSLVFFRFRTIYLILLSLLLFLLVDFASDLFSYCTEVWTKNKTLEDTTGNIPSLKEKAKKETDNSVLKSLSKSSFTALQRLSELSN